MAPTVSQVLALHIRRHTLRKATLTMYREKIRRFIEFLNGDLPVNEVSEDKCLSFRDAVLARCQPSTFNILRRHIVVVFRLAVKEGFIVSSPWANIPPANVLQKPPRKVSTINVDRALVMLSQKFVPIACQPVWFWKAVVGTLYYTGMRRSQLLGLQWGDVDFANQTITLRAETSKNRRQFIVPLPVKIYQLLLAVRAKMLGAGDSYVDGGAPVFNWGLFAPTSRARKLEKLTEWQLQRFFTSLRGALGIEISAHRLRHSAGTELMALTRNPKLVQQMLCHTNIQSTMIYVQPEVAEMRELADRR